MPEETEFWTVGGDPARVTAAVSVGGDRLDPDEVTRLLGIKPTYAARKGDRRRSGGREVVQRTGVWYLEAPPSREWVLPDAIEALLARLPEPGPAWHLIAAKYQLRLTCGVFLSDWNQGLLLPARVLGALASRHLALDLDVYQNGPDAAADV